MTTTVEEKITTDSPTKCFSGAVNAKEAIEKQLSEQKASALRRAKQTRRAVEDRFEDAAYKVKRHRFIALAIAFGAGILFSSILSELSSKRITPERARELKAKWIKDHRGDSA